MLVQSNRIMEACAIASGRGSIDGPMSAVYLGGRNPAISGSEETAWDGGGLYPWSSLATAQALEIVSGSANDTAAGSGARTVRVFGLDADYAPIEEIVTLNGTSAVALTQSYLRVHGARVATAGSGGTNAGNITVQLASGGAAVALILAGFAETQMALYSVPAGRRAYLFSINAQRQASQVFGALIYARPLGGVFSARYYLSLPTIQPVYRQFDLPLVFEAKTDLDFRLLTPGAVGADPGYFDAVLAIEHYEAGA